MQLTLPTVLTIAATLFFLALERIAPGRRLPHVKGWYVRALAINLVQLGITLGLNRVFVRVLGEASLVRLADWGLPGLEGFVAWLTGTFFFYWWHRIRHLNGFWRLFHQIHHSPARIEAVTSFYKHPLEILSDSLLAGLVLYPLLGVSLTGAFWNNFFAATAEYLYHANFKSPRWLRYFIQTPELHSVHHELDVHGYNFGDLPLWDRLFGTYRDATEFAKACGFPRNNERYVLDMLLFRDVYDRPHVSGRPSPGRSG